jgi:hypothetical protein
VPKNSDTILASSCAEVCDFVDISPAIFLTIFLIVTQNNKKKSADVDGGHFELMLKFTKQ